MNDHDRFWYGAAAVLAIVHLLVYLWLRFSKV